MLGLGSNLGERSAHLACARRALGEGAFRWTLASSVWETAAEGGPPGQPPYLNQVLAAPAGTVDAGPEELLRFCRIVEDRAGRRRTETWGPRTLDVDLILYGSLVVKTGRLTVPHPRYAERSFVVGPLAEMLPCLVDPVTGETAAVLWEKADRRDRSCRARGGPRTMPSAQT